MKNGAQVKTPDGTCIRDYIHVTDLARGHISALNYLYNGGASSCINLGSGNGISVMEILDSIAFVTGKTVPTKITSRRPGDPPILVADPGRARELLGYATKYSDIETIIKSAWEFYQDGSG